MGSRCPGAQNKRNTAGQAGAQPPGKLCKALGADLERGERLQLLLADSTAGLKGPHVGDVVSQVVDLKLQHTFVYLMCSIRSSAALTDWIRAGGNERRQHLGGSVPMKDDRQRVMHQISSSYFSFLKF